MLEVTPSCEKELRYENLLLIIDRLLIETLSYKCLKYQHLTFISCTSLKNINQFCNDHQYVQVRSTVYAFFTLQNLDRLH